MVKKIFVAFIIILSLLKTLCAQKNGILPLTGTRYFNEGIWAKNIDVSVDGATLLNDRVPLNKEIVFKLQVPSGFIATGGNYFAGAEVTMTSSKGAVLSKTPNVFSYNEAKGFAAADFKEVIVRVGLQPAIIKSEASVNILIRFYDLKSKNQLRLEFPLTLTKPGEGLQTSRIATMVKASDNANAVVNNLKLKSITIGTDSAIRVNPNLIYLALEIPDIEGSSMEEVLAGTETYWVYDASLNNVKPADKVLKKVGGSMGSSTVNYTLRIPIKLKTNTAKGYIIRFRWESADHKKIIDIVDSK